jgi:ABC-type glycerol-3-phosphate transport system substrate-binding protein
LKKKQLKSVLIIPIVFYHSFTGVPAETLNTIVDAYNNTHSGFSVELKEINPNLYQAAALEALSKEPSERPQLVLAPEYMTGTMNKALKEGIVISVKDLLSKERKEDIAEIVRKTFGEDCLPFNPACGILYINTKMLVDAGYDASWKPSTFEELIEASQKIHSVTGKKGFTCAWPEAYLLEAPLAQTNKSLFDEEGNYNLHQFKDHLILLNKLVREGVFLPPNTGNYNHTKDFFIDGDVAMYMQGSGNFTLICKDAKNIKMSLNFAPLPTLTLNQKVKYAFPLGGGAIWALNTKDKSKEDLHEYMVENVRCFLNYLASQAVQRHWHVSTGYVPVSNSVKLSCAEISKENPIIQAVLSQTLDADLCENSYGIKKENYAKVRQEIYPLIRALITLEGSEDEVGKIIGERLKEFDEMHKTLISP